MGIKINGMEYKVGTASLARSIRRSEKYRVTTEDGVVHREVRATYLDFTLSLGNFGQEDYNALMEELRKGTKDVVVELPRNSNRMERYTGVFDRVGDELLNDDGDEIIWDNLSLVFTGTVPVEV